MMDLGREDSLRLFKFVCSFAWTDLVVTEEERALITRLVSDSPLEAEDIAKVEQWLKVPPAPEEVDPTEIPPEHRQLFVNAVRAVIVADRRIAPSERDSLELFEQLLGR